MRFTEQLTYHGKVKKQLTPVIHNIVFVRTSMDSLSETMTECPVPLYYQKEPGMRRFAIVPDKQMNDFLAVTSRLEEDVNVLDMYEFSLKRGDKVRVTQGIFAGIEGEYVKVRGKKRVVVTLQGMVAATTAFIPFRYVEKL